MYKGIEIKFEQETWDLIIQIKKKQQIEHLTIQDITQKISG